MKSQQLLASYQRGMRFLQARRKSLPGDRSQEAIWSELATIGRNAAAKELRDRLSRQLRIDKRELLKDIQFAAAVEIIVGNCGSDARNLVLKDKPQPRVSIMRISRTADTRQLYRFEGLKEGRFRSIGPQDSDPVYDTVAFREVPSRLARPEV